uniref:uncharacterized protein LOC104266281 n=1 Tax=Ciona intestinalis TaxID=7719 RepID=UPI00089DCD5C|nr:uncharacterized protein LOC104266281 [Ciona intestinalis]|eukprot:XP_018672445.1 uncharacterized protein LOC104266281 [Ciona intestinalis]
MDRSSRSQGTVMCKRCNGRRSLSECNRFSTLQRCQPHEICGMEIRVQNSRRTISVQCKQRQACLNEATQNRAQCRRSSRNKTCRFCCNKRLCTPFNFTCLQI